MMKVTLAALGLSCTSWGIGYELSGLNGAPLVAFGLLSLFTCWLLHEWGERKRIKGVGR